MKHIDPVRHRALFAFGLGLMLINVPLGWLGLVGATAIAAATGDSRWLWLGGGVYLLSWLLLGLGFLIAGKTGLGYARTIRRRRKRMRHILKARARRVSTQSVPPEKRDAANTPE